MFIRVPNKSDHKKLNCTNVKQNYTHSALGCYFTYNFEVVISALENMMNGCQENGEHGTFDSTSNDDGEIVARLR